MSPVDKTIPHRSRDVPMAIKLLVVEDSDDDAKLALRALKRGGLEAEYERVQDAAAFKGALAARNWDAVIADYKMPGFTGLDALAIIKAAGLDIPFILVSGTVGEELAVAAMKAGASDYVMKKHLARLAPALKRELQEAAVRAAHRQARLALAESEARFRALTEISSDFYWESDAGHRLTQRSSADEKVSAVSVFRQGAQIGQRRWEVPYLSPDEPGWQAHRALLDAHLPFRDFEISRAGADGGERHISISGDPTFDAAGAFLGYRGVGSDITARKHAELGLRAAEEQFRGLVEQALTGIYIIQEGRFAYVNQRFAEIFGYTSDEELIGADFLPLVAEGDRAQIEQKIRRRIDGEIKPLSYEFSGVRKDRSIIELGVHGSRATHRGHPAVIGMIQDISEKKHAEARIKRYVAQLEGALMRTVKVATTLSEMRDPYTAGHERRVAEIAVAIGAGLGFDARRQEGLRVAGYLHDVGKMTIPSEILSKPGKLSALEFELIKGHAQASYDVLKDVEFPWPVAEVALQHHERIDGSGYPQGLKGDAILLEARIIAVADVVEAMSSHRPYRPGLGIDRALAEIERGRGTAYEPAVVDACVTLFREKAYAIPD